LLYREEEMMSKRSAKEKNARCKRCHTWTKCHKYGKTYFCSVECADTYRKSIYGVGDCDICGNEYIKTSKAARYCSDECRKISIDINYMRDRWIIFYRDEFKCLYCGAKVYKEDIGELRIEHVFPRKHGGDDTASNLITSCHKCNASKSDLVMDDDILRDILDEVQLRNTRRGIDGRKIIKWN